MVCCLVVGWDVGGPAGKEELGVGGWVIMGGECARAGEVVLEVGGVLYTYAMVVHALR